MRQITFACQPSFEKHARPSRREQFLQTMESVVPWSELEALIASYYPKAGNGRQPIGLAIMLRIYFLQHWFNLSDPGAEDALYGSPALRGFAGVDLPPHGRRPVRGDPGSTPRTKTCPRGPRLGHAAAPNESTILTFRHLLEQHDLCGKILDTMNWYLDSKGIRISTGTIVDATIIAAPSSTKNSKKERDPQMHQTKKGNQYYFGAKAHIGVDSKESAVHSVCTSAASVHDKHMLSDLLHGNEKKVCHPTDEDLSVGTPVWGDAGYQGQTEAIHEAAPKAQDMTNRRVKTKQGVDEDEKRKNRTKSRVREKVEWPFRILKRIFGYTKVRYRGIVKNHHWHLAAFALVNLYQHRKRLILQLAPLGA